MLEHCQRSCGLCGVASTAKPPPPRPPPPPPPSVEQAGGGGVDHLLLVSELRLRLVLPLIGVGLVCVGWTWAACRARRRCLRARRGRRLPADDREPPAEAAGARRGVAMTEL
jgi:hypothetical protein